MSLIPLLALVRKDLRLFFSDRRAVILSFAAPIAIATFFGSIFSGSSTGASARIPIMLTDEDGGEIARAIVASLREDSALRVTDGPADSAREAVRRGHASVAVMIPPGFGDRAGQALFGAGEEPELQLVYDPSHGPEVAMVRGILTGHVLETVSGQMFSGRRGRELMDSTLGGLAATGLPAAQQGLLRNLLLATQRFYASQDSDPATAGEQRGLSLPYTLRQEAATAREDVQYNGYAHAFGGMGVQFLLMVAIDLGVGILLERQRGLWKRLRSAPISRFTLLGGKIASGSVTALLTLLVSFAFAIAVFKVSIAGSFIGFLGIALATALMASTFGLMVAAIGRTPGATRGVSILAVLLMVMLGGAWVPSFLFPAWLQRITLLIPARWSVDGLDAMTWRGIGLAGAWQPIGVLLGFALLFGAIAVWRFRWEEQ
jgi:ABC-2 type transport system permease protein